EASEWGSQKIITKEKDLIADLQSKGMEVVKPDADAFREKAEPAVEALFKKEWPVTTWAEVLSF
ncbi:MAG: C4-dicarboxylate ABC transporter substrate-binding protein, partial [Thermodesulfobacteriota bacterium]